MFKIEVANKQFRGFLRHLFNTSFSKFTFKKSTLSEESFFEKKGFIEKFFTSFWKSKLADMLGLIQVIKKTNSTSDLMFSYNRLVHTNNVPYIIYLENPTALFHYRLNRAKYKRGKKLIENGIFDKNLKAIVCMSRACSSTFQKVIGVDKMPEDLNIYQNYPLVPDNPYVTEKVISERVSNSITNFLFISSEFELKGGYELLKAIKNLEIENKNFHLRIITDKSTISKKSKEILVSFDKTQIELLPFSLSFSQLQQIMARSHALIHPTFKDSFGLTILEAIKSGLPVIGTNLYAIPEMVWEGKNGFLTKPSIQYFDEENLPNKLIWGKDKDIINREIDQNLVQFLSKKMEFYVLDKNLLYEHSLFSFKKSQLPPFSQDFIKQKWTQVFNESLTGKNIE